MIGTLELLYAGLETSNGFAEELRASFAFAIVVFAEVMFLGTNTLLT